MYFNDVYLKRLNRYGENFQSRVKGERERMFDLYLQRSVYKVDFIYDGQAICGSLEKYKKDESQTVQSLQVRNSVTFPIGTILEIPRNEEIVYWMVLYLDELQQTGYNRYIVLKMTHEFVLKTTEGDETFKCFWRGATQNADTAKIVMPTLYLEDINRYTITMPLTDKIQKDSYIEITVKGITEYFRVVGYNRQSNPGVMYVTAEPTIKEEKTTSVPSGQQQSFWFNGGDN